MDLKFSEFISEALGTGDPDFKLKKTSIKDDHIQATIKLYAGAKGMDFKDAEKLFQKALDEKISDLSVVKSINKNSINNACESIAFDMIGTLDPKELDLSVFGDYEYDDLFDRDHFYDLTRFVRGENRQFLPLRNPFETKAHVPTFYVAPDELNKIQNPRLRAQAAGAQTAFCSPDAVMVFNRKFCEQLALSALINNEKTNSSKYVSHGGKIPDHYVYIEGLIMHELLHFSAGDHFFTKPMTEKIQAKWPDIAERAHEILNYVGDYINNWNLAKNGYAQLPIGLYSEDINFDKFDSYDDIIDAVCAIIKPVPKPDYDKMREQMQKGMDEHMDNPDDTPSQGGKDSQPQSQKQSNKNEKSQKNKPPKVNDKSKAKKSDPNQQPLDPKEPDGAMNPEQARNALEKAGLDQDQIDKILGDEDKKPSTTPPGRIYAVGDKVVINSSGKTAVVTRVTKPDDTGKQDIEVEAI